MHKSRSFIKSFIGLVLLSWQFAQAQVIYPIAGLTLSRSTLASNMPEPYDMKMKLKAGYTAGVLVDFPIGKKFSFQTGVVYTQKGQRYSSYYKSDGWEYTELGDFQLNYLEIPVYAKIVLNHDAARPFYLKFGITGAYFLNGKMDLTTNSVSPSQFVNNTSRKVKYKEGYKGFGPPSSNYYYINHQYDLGIYLGVGMKIMKRINVDIGFTQGTIPIGLYAQIEGSNQVFQVSLSTPITIFPKIN